MQKGTLSVFSTCLPLADPIIQSSSTTPEIATPASKTVPQAIRLLYGHSIATQLLEARISSKDQKFPSEDEDEDESAMDIDLPKGPTTWSAEVHFSNANYQAKKMVFLLFINRLCYFSVSVVSRLTSFPQTDRLVESQRMKRSLEVVYHGVLPKGTSPFVYLRYAGVNHC